jgi:hypothetical protein
MDQQDIVATLEAARELIKIGWIKGTWARNKDKKNVDPWSEDACEWCIEGAILAKAHYHPQDQPLADACVRILQAANPEFTDLTTLAKINLGQGAGSKISKASVIPGKNDNTITTHKQVVRMFSNAIKLARGMKWHTS